MLKSVRKVRAMTKKAMLRAGSQTLGNNKGTPRRKRVADMLKKMRARG